MSGGTWTGRYAAAMLWSCRPLNHHGALNGGMSFSPSFLPGRPRYFFLLKRASNAWRGSAKPAGPAARRPVASRTARILKKPHEFAEPLPGIGAGIGWVHSNRADVSK